jgi:hypothetical protein
MAKPEREHKGHERKGSAGFAKVVDTLPYHYGAIFMRLMTAYRALRRVGNLAGGLRNP